MVRLPLFQSSASRPDSPGASFAAARESSSCSAAPPLQTPSTHQLRMSPTADCPASIPKYPGMIEPLTMPQIPGTCGDEPLGSSIGEIAQSHVDVPMILTSVPSAMPDPTAP